jgi:hypothetical protein
MVAVSSFPAISRLLPREPVLGDRRALPATTTPPQPASTPPPTTAAGASPSAPTPKPAVQTTAAAVAAAGATVKLSVSLPMALAAFNASAQQAFREVMAVAAGLTRGDAARVALALRDGGRRLLGASVGVDVTISMPDAASARLAAASLTADKINAGLKSAGLPDATITSAPAVSTPQGSAAAAVGGRVLAWAWLAAAAAVCATA